jgi:hypothetical protein
MPKSTFSSFNNPFGDKARYTYKLTVDIVPHIIFLFYTKMASLHELKGKTDKNFIASEHTTMITREYADNNDNNMKHSKHPKNNIE